MIQTPPKKAIRTHVPTWLDVAKMFPAAANGRDCGAAPPHHPKRQEATFQALLQVL